MRIMKQMLSQMIVLATNSHDGQFDKGGNPYILHPLAVMHLLQSNDEELLCIGLGHDIIEDCGVTYEQLREQGFTDRIINGIKDLTKVPGESHNEYMQKILNNIDACKVKLCDLQHNSDIRRLKGVTEKDIRRIEKYHNMYLQIKEHLVSLGKI